MSAVVQERVQCAMEVGASTLGDAARVNLTLGCGAHSWSVVKLLWQGSRRNRWPADGCGGKLFQRSACWPMCGGLADCWSEGGDDAWFLPPTEEVAESGHCMELGVACSGGSIGDGVGDGVEAVDNGVG